MKVSKTKLKGVLSIELEVFEDFRGQFIETYNEKLYRDNGIDIKFVQDDISISTSGVLRGIHGDSETCKLISCLYGKFYFVVVNCDTESKDFGKWEAFTMSDTKRQQILVPPKYGNAYFVMSDKTIFQYKQSTYYDPSGQFTYKWNDPKFNIWWPTDKPILSQRDQLGHFV